MSNDGINDKGGTDWSKVEFRRGRHSCNEQSGLLWTLFKAGLIIVVVFFAGIGVMTSIGFVREVFMPMYEYAMEEQNMTRQRDHAGHGLTQSQRTAQRRPSWADKTDEEKMKCMQAANLHVQMAAAYARFQGVEMAKRNAMSQIEDDYGRWCLEYWAANQ